ncbi:MAG: exosortase A [Rhodoferax sp.]|jgi:exosortase A|nr:exosortase A [Rhodoferax sp.]
MTPLAQTQSRQNWRQALPVFLLLLALTLSLFHGTASAIVTIWLRSDTFTHGFLVPPIVIWLVWRRRQVLADFAPQPSYWGMLMLAGAAFAWLLGDLVAVNAVTQLALVAMLVLMVPTLLGFAVARAVMFPLAFMFFAVPFGEFAMPQLMVWTADFTVMALRLSGIPVLREGLQFVIPSGNWSVVEACSGVRYLIASLTVGTLFAYLNYQSTMRRVLFIVVSILVPVTANWARAYIIVMLGHLSGNKLATGVDHLIYGWLFFGIVILLMFMVGAHWAEPEPSADASPGHAAEKAMQSASVQAPAPGYWSAHRSYVLALVFLVALPHFARWAIEVSDRAAAPQLPGAPILAPAWSLAPSPVADFKPAFQNPSASINNTYQSQSKQVGLYMGYYRQQDYSRKLVSSDNVLVKLKDSPLAQVSAGTRTMLLDGQTRQFRTTELRGSPAPGLVSDNYLLVWQIYWVNGTWTTSDIMAKLYAALYRLLGRGDDSAVIILYTIRGQSGEGQTTLEAFVQANTSALNTLLLQTRARR